MTLAEVQVLFRLSDRKLKALSDSGVRELPKPKKKRRGGLDHAAAIGNC